MQRLSRKEIIVLALVLAFVFLLFFLNIPILAWQESKALDTSAYLSTPQEFHAFPLIDVEQTTIHRPTLEPANQSAPSLVEEMEKRGRNESDVTATSGLRVWTKEEVQGLIRTHAANVAIDPAIPLAIAFHESGYQYQVINPSSGACGVMQYLPTTWSNTEFGKQGVDCRDANANISAAIFHMSVHGYSPWNASRHKWGHLLSNH